MSLDGKVAIVTGGATGIGLGIAEVLASRGVRLALVQRSQQRLREAAAMLRETNEVLTFSLSIADRAAVEQMVQDVEKHFGRIDILANNASVTGTPALSGFLDCSQEHIDAVIDTNLKGTFYCSQAVARAMVERGEGGSIIHISSVGAYAAQEHASLYCATKAAQVSLARSMALELAPHRIRVNAIAPGPIDTRASANIVEDLQEQGGSDRYVRTTPLGHWGKPRDVGTAVAFLASDEAEFITGATLLVDGGWMTY